MSRGFWFVAGAGAGVYAVVRARRAAETFTPEGIRDRMAGLGVGAQLFAEELRAGMTEKETELREQLGWALDGPPEITAAEPRAMTSTGSRVSTGSADERKDTD
jgi:hypothetical protein